MRKSHQKSRDKNTEPALNVVEWSLKKYNSYNNFGYNPLKLGDLRLLKAIWDKNNTTSYFIVSKTDIIPDGINFDEQTIGVWKVGVRETATNYMFSFFSTFESVRWK